MSNKTTDSLIDSLTDDLKPVKRLLHPYARILPWIFVAIVYLAGIANFLGIRMDIMDKLHEAPFLFEMVLASLIAITGAYAAGLSTIPDMRSQQWFMAVPATQAGIFLIFVICTLIAEGTDHHSLPRLAMHHCFSDGLLIAFVPIIMLILLVKRGATTHPNLSSFMSILSVGALGWMTLRLTCGSDNLGHMFLHHFGPYLLLGIILGLLARRLYRW